MSEDDGPMFGMPHHLAPSIDQRWEAAIRDLGGMVRAMGDDVELVIRKGGEQGALFNVKVGSDYAVCPGRGKNAIGRVVVADVRLTPLGQIDDAEARREGFGSAVEFKRAFCAINGIYDPAAKVWRVAFELLREYPVTNDGPREHELNLMNERTR